jgi:hypothetical protein
MHGVASDELKDEELEHHDPEYEMLLVASVVKRGGKP